MRERKKKPVLIKELIDVFFKDHKKEKQTTQEKILKNWEEIIPKNALKYTKPITIKNKKIIISVSNSSWLHQLTLKKQEILKNIKKITNNNIEDISFKIGR